MERARLHDTQYRLKLLASTVNENEKNGKEFVASKAEQINLRNEFEGLDSYMKDKGNRMMDKIYDLVNRTERLEKYVFEKEKPILKIVEQQI